MANHIWISNLFATLLTTIVLMPTITQSNPQRYEYTNPTLDEIFQTDQLNRRADTHPIFLKLRNAPAPAYSLPKHGGSPAISFPNFATVQKDRTYLDWRKTRRMTSDNTQRGSPDQDYNKDGTIVFREEGNAQHLSRFANRKSLVIRDDNKHFSGPHLNSNFSANILPGKKGTIKSPMIPPAQARGKREIVFPGTIFPRPNCAGKGQIFCIDVENYPEKHLEAILKSQPGRYEQLFGDDIVPINVTQHVDVEDETLCGSIERLIFPRAGVTKDENWLYIINQSNYTQGIRVEECTNPGGKCAMTSNFPLDYKTECKQKYIYRQMLGFNADGRVVKDLFHFPSCCKCVLTHIGASN